MHEEKRNLMHLHVMIGDTSCDKGHCHLFTGTTGPEIEMAGGRHYHEFEGMTSFDFGHWHSFCGQTGVNNELPDGFHTHKITFTTDMVKEHRHEVDTFNVPVKEPEHHSDKPARIKARINPGRLR
ncbi:MAG: hypothetical protein GXX09_09820 [Syntrophomonadaceae bacterium]|nr:hypothetical protein [Syntrophomonadaceae bacterium]